MTYEEWYNKNEEEIWIELAEIGADREMDFNSEVEFNNRYDYYCQQEMQQELDELNGQIEVAELVKKVLKTAADGLIGFNATQYVEFRDGIAKAFSFSNKIHYEEKS